MGFLCLFYSYLRHFTCKPVTVACFPVLGNFLTNEVKLRFRFAQLAFGTFCGVCFTYLREVLAGIFSVRIGFRGFMKDFLCLRVGLSGTIFGACFTRVSESGVTT